MSIAVSFPSAGGQTPTTYTVPEPGDVVTQSLTDYLVALASKTLAIPTADLDLGASFGIKSIYYKTRTANPAASGVVRLANADTIAWRNAANGADLALSVDSGNNLLFAGANVTGNPLAVYNTTAAPVVANGATSIINFASSETDSDSAVTTGASWHFTVPTGKGGDYEIAGYLSMNTTQAGSINLQVFKNGVLTKLVCGVNAQTVGVSLGGSVVLRLVAADTIDFRVNNAGAGSQTFTATAAGNWCSIKRIPT